MFIIPKEISIIEIIIITIIILEYANIAKIHIKQKE